MLDTVLRWLGCDVQHVSPATFAKAEVDMWRYEVEVRQQEYFKALTTRNGFNLYNPQRKPHDDALKAATARLLEAETNLILAKNSLAKAMEK